MPMPIIYLTAMLKTSVFFNILENPEICSKTGFSDYFQSSEESCPSSRRDESSFSRWSIWSIWTFA